MSILTKTKKTILTAIPKTETTMGSPSGLPEGKKMKIPLFGKETNAQPVIPVSFQFQWDLDYPGAFVKVNFSPETGEITMLYYDDPGTGNDLLLKSPEALSAFFAKYPATAKGIRETISRLRSL